MSERAERKLRVLVVDDEPNVCYCLKLMLASEGHEIAIATSGEAALESFEKGKFDLVFTDYSMPGMRGDELAGALKAIAPELPVLMITGYAPSRDATASVDLVLTKPFLLEQIRDAIARVTETPVGGE